MHGNREFLRICVELAAEHGFKIANPDLQEAIAVERERQQRAKDVDQAPRDDVRETGSNALAATYRRHFDDIVREQPHRRGMIPREWMRRSRSGCQ